MFFERENAAKRNVATRQPARDVSWFLLVRLFDFEKAQVF
jgi:hypothetical protein